MTHAQVALRLIVIKWRGKIGKEAVRAYCELGFVWFAGVPFPLFRFLGAGGGGLAWEPSLRISLSPCEPLSQYTQIQFVLAQRFGLLSLSFHVQEQIFHRSSPGLPQSFLDKRDVASVMDVDLLSILVLFSGHCGWWA